MTDNLRDRLDDMLAMLAPSPAPAEAAIRMGKRIRWRRRASAAAGLAVVIAAAAIVPSAVHVGAPPAPATTYRGPQYSVTEQLPGPHSPQGEIAQGTINGKSWRYMAYEPGTVSLGGTRQSGLCLQGVGPALGGKEPMLCGQAPGPGGPGTPMGFGCGGNCVAMVGGVTAEVSYATVTLTNGTVLTLHPVQARGGRYVAFAAPRGTVTMVVAYSRHGEIASSAPYNVDGVPSFGAWYPPGQHGPARASAVIGTGTFDGIAWSIRLSFGPSGECVDFGGMPACGPYTRPAGTAIVQYSVSAGLSSAIAEFLGSAAPAVSRIAIEFPGGKTVVRPVTVAGRSTGPSPRQLTRASTGPRTTRPGRSLAPVPANRDRKSRLGSKMPRFSGRSAAATSLTASPERSARQVMSRAGAAIPARLHSCQT